MLNKFLNFSIQKIICFNLQESNMSVPLNNCFCLVWHFFGFYTLICIYCIVKLLPQKWMACWFSQNNLIWLCLLHVSHFIFTFCLFFNYFQFPKHTSNGNTPIYSVPNTCTFESGIYNIITALAKKNTKTTTTKR